MPLRADECLIYRARQAHDAEHAASPALPSQVVGERIKPLEWHKSNVADRWTAPHPFGNYEIVLNKRDGEFWSPQFGGISGRCWDSLNAAQAAISAEHTYAIQSCLTSPAAEPVDDDDWSFQQRVGGWMLQCFTPGITADKLERNDRFIEEALELVQSLGYSADRAHALVDYVFGRPIGEPEQEVGGVMVTLAALCNPNGLNMDYEAERELTRILAPEIINKIRAKQASKPVGSALPVPHPAPSASREVTDWWLKGPFKFNDRVEKAKGSSWHGKVCGWYTTSLTPVGYCVESEREPGSVQLYPAAALLAALPEREG